MSCIYIEFNIIFQYCFKNVDLKKSSKNTTFLETYFFYKIFKYFHAFMQIYYIFNKFFAN